MLCSVFSTISHDLFFILLALRSLIRMRSTAVQEGKMELIHRIRVLRPVPVNVPLHAPLLTGGGIVPYAPLVLLDLETDQGVVGSSYMFCPSAYVQRPVTQLVESLNEPLCREPLAPLLLEEKLRGLFRLVGLSGIVTLGMSLIDMAAWDALAKTGGFP